MCIIIMKPEGKVLSEEILRNAFHNNNDGAGFAVVEKDEKGQDEVNTYRGIFHFKQFMKEWNPFEKHQAILHFRIATHKLISGKNCHPFRVSDDLVFAHNGHIHNLPDSDKLSDTGIFCEKILKPLVKVNPDFWLMPSFKWFIENAIGSGNKLVMLDAKKRFAIFNESMGNWKDDCWFSNYSYTTRWWNRSGWEEYEYDQTSTAQHDEDVIDVQSEVIESKTSPQTTSAEFQLTYEPQELEEIDKRLEEMQGKSCATV